jgi:protein-S-isoprenylcysteine O-methyltransferase Ste14
MSLRTNFETSGNWLFKRRSYLPLVLIVVVVMAMLDPSFAVSSRKFGLGWEFVCLMLSFFGLTIRSLTIGFTPKNTSGRNTHAQVAEVLNTSGIYSVVRHPLYLGNFIIWLGISLFVHLWWLTLIFILIFWLYYERIMFAEEEFLRKKFGQEFEKWAEITPAFLPRFENWDAPQLTFSMKNMLQREFAGFFAIIAVFAFLVLAKNYFLDNKFYLNTVWLTIFLLGLLIYLIIRFLKKRTRILSVEGR